MIIALPAPRRRDAGHGRCHLQVQVATAVVKAIRLDPDLLSLLACVMPVHGSHHDHRSASVTVGATFKFKLPVVKAIRLDPDLLSLLACVPVTVLGESQVEQLTTQAASHRDGVLT
jgi:hypothetical protein